MDTAVDAAATHGVDAAVMALCVLTGLRRLIDRGGVVRDDVLYGLPVLEFEGTGEVYVECFGGPWSGEVFIGWTVDGEHLLTRRTSIVKAVAGVRYLVDHQTG